MSFANLRIGKRLALGFALVLMLSIIIAAIGIWRLHAVSVETHAMMDHPLTKERLISDWYTNLATDILRTTAIAKSSDLSLGPYFAEGAISGSKSSSDIQKKMDALVSTERERALFQKLGGYRKAYLAARDSINLAKTGGNIDEVNRVLDQQFVPAGNGYRDQMRQLLDLQRQDIDRMAAQVDIIADDSLKLVSTLECLALILGALCAWYLTAGITRPIEVAVRLAHTVAGGDLTSRIAVTTRDQTGQLMQSLKDMNDNLFRVVGQVRTGTDTIAAATTQIAAGNLDLSSRTEQQAASLEETASSMEQLTSTVKQNADNARQANQLAVSASEVAAKGGEVVTQVVETMASINQSSRRIVDIISVIDGIAFQTNILALNAAVEAARAGEQGRGFAVVASEVRNLAQRSAGAAKEIKSLIDDSVSKTDAGTILVGQAGVTMDEVVNSIRRVTEVMSEITAASQEQTVGIEQVNQAIAQMDQVTQQNAALVEQAAAAAASLQDQAVHLSQVVSVFTLADKPVGVRKAVLALQAG